MTRTQIQGILKTAVTCCSASCSARSQSEAALPWLVVGVLNVLLDALGQRAFGRRQRLHGVAARTDVQQFPPRHHDDADDDTDKHQQEQDDEDEAGDVLLFPRDALLIDGVHQ